MLSSTCWNPGSVSSQIQSSPRSTRMSVRTFPLWLRSAE